MPGHYHFDIARLEVGPMQNLVYLIGDHGSSRTAVIDPTGGISAVLSISRAWKKEITDVLISHRHRDRVDDLPELLMRCDAKVHLSREEVAFWKEAPLGRVVAHRDGDQISVGNTIIEIIHTPGHTPGSACFHLDGHLFTGGTLLVFGCGRCDLPGGDARQMLVSLCRLQARFPGSTRVMPGHHYAHQAISTLAEQTWGNPFFHFKDVETFVQFRAEHNEHRHPPYQPVPPGTAAW